MNSAQLQEEFYTTSVRRFESAKVRRVLLPFNGLEEFLRQSHARRPCLHSRHPPASALCTFLFFAKALTTLKLRNGPEISLKLIPFS